MKAEFDAIAEKYDATFTVSFIGRLQRNQVYRFLAPILKNLKGRNVLDLGCGTGEDAIWFAKNNFSVAAIDSSKEMIQIAKNKATNVNLTSLTHFHHHSLLDLNQIPEDQKFDLIFSNFGAINCIDPTNYSLLAKGIYDRLHTKGDLVIVVLNKFCLWESAYFLFKRKFKNIFRRMNPKGVMATLTEEVKVKTYYLYPHEFSNFFSSHFQRVTVSPIGFFVPPSYLTWFEKEKNTKWLHFFEKLDRMNPFKLIASYMSDHFIIHMTRK